MGMVIIVSPFSRKLNSGQKNPKNYPYWREVVQQLKQRYADCEIWQVGFLDEERIPTIDRYVWDKSFVEIEQLLRQAEGFVSVDNYFHHLATVVGKMGVVIWSVSDPAIFGHPTHFNIYKDKSFFRPNQYDIWEHSVYNPEAYVEPQTVVQTFNEIILYNQKQR